MNMLIEKIESLFEDNQLNWGFDNLQCLFDENKDEVEELIKTQHQFRSDIEFMIENSFYMKKTYEKWGYERTPFNSDILDRTEEYFSSLIGGMMNEWEDKFGLCL